MFVRSGLIILRVWKQMLILRINIRVISAVRILMFLQRNYRNIQHQVYGPDTGNAVQPASRLKILQVCMMT